MQHHLLIADGDRAWLDELATALRKQGHQVTTVESASSVLAQAESLLPSAILLEARPSGGSGWSVCNRLKKHPVLRRVPLILIAEGEESRPVFAQHQSLATRADAYAIKPMPPDELLGLVDPLLPKDRTEYLQDLYRIREASPSLKGGSSAAILWISVALAAAGIAVAIYYLR